MPELWMLKIKYVKVSFKAVIQEYSLWSLFTFYHITDYILSKTSSKECYSLKLARNTVHIMVSDTVLAELLFTVLRLTSSWPESFTSRGVQPFGVSGPHWKKSCLEPHIKYTNTNENWWAKKKVHASLSWYLPPQVSKPVLT